MYNLIFIILRIVFHDVIEFEEAMIVWFTFDYLSDFIYICDIFVQSRIGRHKTIKKFLQDLDADDIISN